MAPGTLRVCITRHAQIQLPAAQCSRTANVQRILRVFPAHKVKHNTALRTGAEMYDFSARGHSAETLRQEAAADKLMKQLAGQAHATSSNVWVCVWTPNQSSCLNTISHFYQVFCCLAYRWVQEAKHASLAAVRCAGPTFQNQIPARRQLSAAVQSHVARCLTCSQPCTCPTRCCAMVAGQANDYVLNHNPPSQVMAQTWDTVAQTVCISACGKSEASPESSMESSELTVLGSAMAAPAIDPTAAQQVPALSGACMRR